MAYLSERQQDGAEAIVDSLRVGGGQLCQQILHKRSLRPLQAGLQLWQPRQPHIQRHLQPTWPPLDSPVSTTRRISRTNTKHTLLI